MKKNAKRLLAGLLGLALLLPAMAACKKDPDGTPDNPDSDPIEAAVREKVTHVYKGDYVAVPEKISLNSRTYALSGDNLVFMATEVLNEGDPETGEGYESRRILYSIPLSGGDAVITALPQKLTTTESEKGREYASIGSVSIGADGSFVVYENKYNYEKDTNINLLTAYAADGSEIYSIDPEPLNEERTDPRADMRGGMSFPYQFYVQNMVQGANGTLYIVTEYSIMALSPTGEKLYEIPVSGYVENISPTTDGKVLVSYMDYSDYENRLVYMDDEKRGFSDPVQLPTMTQAFRNAETFLGEGYSFYFKTDTGLYGLNESDAEPTLLCSWINSDVDPRNIRNLLIVDADTFLYVGSDPVSYQTEIAIMNRLPDEEVPEKYLIRIGGTYFAYDFTGYVVKFNRQSDEYRVVLENYGDYNTNEDYQAGEKKLEEDILAGREPDILYSQGYDASFANYADKGVFADLYTLMDADPTFDRTKLLPCVLKPFEVDGKLYQLASNFSLNGFMGKTKNVGSYADNWTIDTMLALVEECEKTGKTFMGELTRENMEQMLITYNLASYIDYENATCTFDTETFLKVLEFVKSLPTSQQFYENYDYEESRLANAAGLRDDKVMLAEGSLYSFSDYLQKKATMLMEDVTMLGLPTPEGGAVILQGQTTFSVASRSPVQAGAWEFVKYMFSDEVTGGGEMRGGRDGFSATYAGMQALAKEEMSMYYTFQLDGSGWGASGWDGVNIPERDYDPEKEIPGYLKQEDVDAFIKMLETGRFISNVNAGADEKLNSLIAEELGAYYAGNSSAADTAKKIQSRVSIYLAEKS